MRNLQSSPAFVGMEDGRNGISLNRRASKEAHQYYYPCFPAEKTKA